MAHAARTRTAHGTNHAQTQRNLFKLFAVFVLAIIHRMNQLVDQGVKHQDRIKQRRRNEDLILIMHTTFA